MARCMSPRIGWLLAIVPIVALAEDPRAEPVQGVAEVMTNQLGALTRASPRGVLEPVRVYFRGHAVRIEFTDRGGKPYVLLIPDGAKTGWILDATGAIPVPRAPLPVVMDLDAPCGASGLLVECTSRGPALVDGLATVQWRYRLPAGRGPGGTNRGTLWLDPLTGVVVRYVGSAGIGPLREWRVTRLEYGPVPASLFEVPETHLRPQSTLRR